MKKIVITPGFVILSVKRFVLQKILHFEQILHLLHFRGEEGGRTDLGWTDTMAYARSPRVVDLVRVGQSGADRKWVLLKPIPIELSDTEEMGEAAGSGAHM